MKETVSRVSIPGRVMDLLWGDDEFFRDVISNKKTSSAGKFPRCDQWCDEEGFHMAFALAGYSPSDVLVSIRGNELFISGSGTKVDAASQLKPPLDEEEYPAKTPKVGVQQGMIVRGIARRNFKTKYFINNSFDLSKSRSFMKDGLLEILIPRKEELQSKEVNIEER